MEPVCKICTTIKHSTKTGVSFKKLLATIRKEFIKGDIEILLRPVRDNTLTEEVFYANGYYDPEDDENNECHIELVITHNFPKNHIWYPDQATELLIQIFDTVIHELRHQRQYRARDFLPGRDKVENTHIEYLADPDEIDAYSITIATELCRSLGKQRALRYLKTPSKLARFKIRDYFVSPSLGMYQGTFTDPDSVVLKQLIKKVYIRLKKIDTDFVFM